MAAHGFDGASNLSLFPNSAVSFPVTGGSAIPQGMVGWGAMLLPPVHKYFYQSFSITIYLFMVLTPWHM